MLKKLSQRWIFGIQLSTQKLHFQWLFWPRYSKPCFDFGVSYLFLGLCVRRCSPLIASQKKWYLSYLNYIWVFPKIVVFPPKSSICSKGVPLFFTIHFGGTTIFGNTNFNFVILVRQTLNHEWFLSEFEWHIQKRISQMMIAFGHSSMHKLHQVGFICISSTSETSPTKIWNSWGNPVN